MNKFEVIQPSTLLATYVKQYWFLKMENSLPVMQRLVPFGYSALSFYRRHRVFSLFENEYLPHSHIMGIATQPKDIIISGKIDFICVIFQPSAYQSIFNDPYFNANNNFVSLDSLNDKKLLQLEQQLHETEDNRTCVALIEQFLFHRIYHLARYEDKRINAVMQAISKGEHNIHTLAEIACLSYKQFNRVFANATGTQPKAYLRLTRFQKLKHLLQSQSNANLEQLAEQCGYYDKSHLIKELNAFSNFTPKEFVTSSNSPYSEYHALFRSAFIDIQHNQI